MWLYAPALALQIEVPDRQLSEKAGEAAFTLTELLSRDVESEDEEDLEMRLTWEEPQEALPQDLSYLWHKSRSGDRLELREVLFTIAKIKDFPKKAP